jgi:hypothetical protein
MIHGPRGELNIRSPCMNNRKCSKKYPHKLVKDTQTGDDGYPTYRRRLPDDGGYTAILKVRGQKEKTHLFEMKMHLILLNSQFCVLTIITNYKNL